MGTAALGWTTGDPICQAVAIRGFSESRETRRNLTRRQLPGLCACAGDEELQVKEVRRQSVSRLSASVGMSGNAHEMCMGEFNRAAGSSGYFAGERPFAQQVCTPRGLCAP